MHAVFFGMKRAHLSWVEVAKKVLEMTELTPARFDLMRILKLRPEGTQQGTVQWLLGVAAPTVSRMLKGLEELGFVVRERDRRDRRCKVVRLTEAGVDELELAEAMAIESGVAGRFAAQSTRGERGTLKGIDPALTARIIEEAKGDVEASEVGLGKMRKAFRDRAPFRHPWRTQYVNDAVVEFVDGKLLYNGRPLGETN